MKRGFTLVELLAVIVILALLFSITSYSVANFINDSKNSLYEDQIKLIKDASQQWASSNIYSLPDKGECICLTLKDLKDEGFIDSNIIDPRNKTKISENLVIKIEYIETDYNQKKLVYTVNPADTSGCSFVY